MKRIAILGSTGSIGKNSIHIARHLKDSLRVTALAAQSNIDLLEEQAKEFKPEIIAVYDKNRALELKKRLPQFHIVGGMEGLNEAAAHSNVDFVVSAITGTIGLIPTITAIQAGKTIGLANKEALVSGGALVIALAKAKGVPIIPIDSEHSAIFQCLNGDKHEAIRRLIVTASGGPFRTFSDEQLNNITAADALKHPTWSMGPKVTIDSSTLMNKGLEVIEAHWLFNIPASQIEVVVHPQSIIHSAVEFVDHSIIAQMGDPNMITPIQYALTYPKRLNGSLKPFDFFQRSSLQFFIPDLEKFRCLSLAYSALEAGGSMACYMNAANEVLVNRFLQGEISWKEIATKLEQLMSQHAVQKVENIETILAVDTEAKLEAKGC